MSDEQSDHNIVSTKNIKLGVVCPMANEKDTVQDFIRAVLENCKGFKEVQFFAIFDKACKDGTFDLLNNMENKPKELQVVWAPENTCVVDAYIKGYKKAIEAGCDWILEIDGGFSHNPEEIPKFIEMMLEGYDCVFGSRFIEGGSFKESPLSRRFISKGGTIAANILLGTKLKDMTSGFEMFTRSGLKEVLEKGIKSKGHFFQTEIKTYCRKMKIAEVPINYRAPSQNINGSVMLDSFKHLFRLFVLRLTGKL